MFKKYYNTNGKIPVHSDDGKRIIGEITDGIFTKSNWHSKKHLCFKYRSIGIDKGAVDDYVVPLATSICIPDRDNNGREYRADIEHFIRHSFEVDLGWGVQRHMKLDLWQVIEHDSDRPRQLSLTL